MNLFLFHIQRKKIFPFITEKNWENINPCSNVKKKLRIVNCPNHETFIFKTQDHSFLLWSMLPGHASKEFN